ncbi:hypothetical protein QNH48_28735 [Neobacillus sp. YX16]|uniref:SGNH/GDSL hydrolase family protein n=1 Tax=Neobacillus sp. YX16 TaxID=3047874 RepID=UPI0024C30E53|nr:hypothetical protein [Neobacillus sp. YX16]WHZ02859.1 hypothetical protein QNH48_28735 [Neobacillus sp. YX16]
MKYFLTALWAFICIGVLAYSHLSWNKQTSVQAVISEPETKDKQESIEGTIDHKYIELAGNWPKSAIDKLTLSLKEGNPYKILFVGSTTSEWENVVSTSITDSFGSERVTNELLTYDLTSEEFVAENKQLEIAAKGAQLIVIEPFLLNDNGVVTIDVTLANLTKIIEDIKADNPGTTFLLQPSYPIYLPKYYSTQIEELKAYAKENNITYLDHWTAWPSTDNLEIKEYLDEQQSGPSEKGYQVWAQYLVEYFVNK